MSDGGKGLVDVGAERTRQVARKVEMAMKAMEKEIIAADGIYPHRSGRLSAAEVCRRAGIHPITLHGDCHKTTTRVKVLQWVARVTGSGPRGASAVQKEVHARATQWKDRYIALAAQFKNMHSIEIVSRDRLINEQKNEIKKLREELRRARRGESNVVPIRRT